MSDFFYTLFDENEHTCFSENQLGTKIYDIDSKCEEVHKWATFFSINPINPTTDMKPTESYHNVNKPRRADVNVIAYRNILIEMDSIPVEEQNDFIKGIGMPYTTAVFSGNKSIHYIISLVTPVADEKTYRKLVERVYKALGGKGIVDVSCKNPSRFSRLPNAYRADKDKTQELLFVGERIENSTLDSWLNSRGAKEIEETPNSLNSKRTYSGSVNKNTPMNGFTLNFIMCGAPEGERNSSLFKASCDLFKCGYTEDQIIERLEKPSGLDSNEVAATIKSAIRKVQNS